MVRLWPEADVAAAVGFVPMAAATWGVRAGAAWTAAVLAGLELLSLLVASAAARAPRIPVQGRALETLAPKGRFDRTGGRAMRVRGGDSDRAQTMRLLRSTR
jgi:hypothetical protein